MLRHLQGIRWRRGIAALAVVAGLIASAELAARAWLRPEQFARETLDIQSPSQLIPKLDYLKGFPGRKIVILGDSLIYGRTMQKHGDDQWRRHTLAVRLENELAAKYPGEKLLVMNLGINGALPKDMEALARLVVPCGVDALILDTHLRQFSGDFAAGGQEYCRPWLAELSTNEQGKIVYRPAGNRLDRLISRAGVWLTRHSALCQMRQVIQDRSTDAPLLARGQKLRNWWNRVPPPIEDPDALGDDLLLLAQLKGRLDSVHFRDEHPQLLAMRRLLGYCRESHQRTIVFNARENPDQISAVMTRKRYRALQDQLATAIGSGCGGEVSFVPALEDHAAEDFLDFIHLNAQGYERLAGRLSQQLR